MGAHNIKHELKKSIIYFLIIWCAICEAQQTIIYTQYAFNKAGVNPAASGTDINQKFNYVFGVNRQWVGFDNAPKQNFANFSMTIRPPRSYHYWQNVGVYLDTEENGPFSNNGVYANYTIHLLLKKKLVASFGVYAGVRNYNLSPIAIDKRDPIMEKSNFRTLVYPDIIPGFRLNNQKFFIDLALRQITVYKLQDFQGNKISGTSKLKPTLFFAYGRKIPLNDIFVLMPSVALNATILHYPAVDVNAMVYYINRMGGGIALRNLSILSFIYQVRIFKNLSVGVSYGTSLNSVRYVAPSSFEIMIGITPTGLDDKSTGKHSIARCPGLDF